MKSKTIIASLLFATMGTAIGTVSVSSAKGPSKSNQVTICHFNGHDGDFVTRNSEASPNNFCLNAGGLPITVAEQACENGHRAEALPRFRLTCADGYLQGN